MRYLFISLAFSIKLVWAQQVLFLSDIHFDPYELCKSTQATCPVLNELIKRDIQEWPQILTKDTSIAYHTETGNKYLIDSLAGLTKIAQQQHISQVFLTGDILTHKFDKLYYKYANAEFKNQATLTKFSQKTSAYVLTNLANALKPAPIFFVLGNNDGDRADYSVPSKEFLSFLAQQLAPNLAKAQQADFIQTFSSAGYYSVTLNAKTLLVGINSNLLVKSNPNSQLATTQLIWLEKTLAQAKSKQQKVIMLQHIPYGADPYKSRRDKKVAMLMESQLQAKYVQVVQQYAAIIDSIYAGHFHSDYLQVIPNTRIPVISTIALNSHNGNNPGFKVLDLTNNGQLKDYLAYNADLHKNTINWQLEYQFSKLYAKPIVNLIQHMPESANSSEASIYRQHYRGNNPDDQRKVNATSDWPYYYCSLNNITQEAYTHCLDKTLVK